MAYRNELDAAHAQLEVLRERNRNLSEENRILRKAPTQKRLKTSREKGPRVVRSGFRYEKPATLWPMFEDWNEMVAFFSSADSDSVLAWIGGRLGFLFAVLFFTPCLALTSVLVLPLVVLSGFKIGRSFSSAHLRRLGLALSNASSVEEYFVHQDNDNWGDRTTSRFHERSHRHTDVDYSIDS